MLLGDRNASIDTVLTFHPHFQLGLYMLWLKAPERRKALQLVLGVVRRNVRCSATLRGVHHVPTFYSKFSSFYSQYLHGCSQHTRKVGHTKGILLDHAMILTTCVPNMIISLRGKNLLTEGVNSFLYEQFLIVWKITFIT